jgi:hypothetical protein
MTEEAFERYARAAAQLLQRALARIEKRVRGGERRVARTLGAVSEEPTFARLVLSGEGGGELWFAADRSGMRALSPGDVPPAQSFGYAVEVPLVVAAHLLEQLASGAIEDEAALLSLAALASDRARELFGATAFAFLLQIRGVEGLGVVDARVNIGRPALGAAPEFTLRLAAADLAETFEQDAPPQRLFLEGKVDIDGDVAKAMLLGMLLAEIG